MIEVGKPAPAFSGPAYQAGELVTVGSSSFPGRWIVLFFYPADFTFVCPTELRGFAAEHERFNELEAQVVAVSTDSVFCHQAWIERDLPEVRFAVIGDTTHALAEAFKVLDEDTGQAERGTFIIDPEGTLRYAVVSDRNVGRSVRETLRVLEALKSGALCPVEWAPGERTLGPGASGDAPPPASQ